MLSTIKSLISLFLTLEGYRIANWIDAGQGWVPHGLAVAGGDDINNETLYVGRALHEGETIPGKIVQSHGVCYVSYAGEEIACKNYQALVSRGCELVWIHSSGGSIPIGALQGGETIDGEPLYIGRQLLKDHYCIGKIHPSHGSLYLPFDGKEHAFNDYQILCVRNINCSYE